MANLFKFLLIVFTLISLCDCDSPRRRRKSKRGSSSASKAIHTKKSKKKVHSSHTDYTGCCELVKGDTCFCKTDKYKTECDCDYIVSLSLFYEGDSKLSHIKVYDTHTKYPRCKFNDVSPGDELFCDTGSNIFSESTSFKLKKEDGSQCIGYVDTSCYGHNIVDKSINGCDDLIITGFFSDVKAYGICGDGLTPCSCDDTSAKHHYDNEYDTYDKGYISDNVDKGYVHQLVYTASISHPVHANEEYITEGNTHDQIDPHNVVDIAIDHHDIGINTMDINHNDIGINTVDTDIGINAVDMDHNDIDIKAEGAYDTDQRKDDDYNNDMHTEDHFDTNQDDDDDKGNHYNLDTEDHSDIMHQNDDDDKTNHLYDDKMDTEDHSDTSDEYDDDDKTNHYVMDKEDDSDTMDHDDDDKTNDYNDKMDSYDDESIYESSSHSMSSMDSISSSSIDYVDHMEVKDEDNMYTHKDVDHSDNDVLDVVDDTITDHIPIVIDTHETHEHNDNDHGIALDADVVGDRGHISVVNELKELESSGYTLYPVFGVSILCMINVMMFLYCCWYKPKWAKNNGIQHLERLEVLESSVSELEEATDVLDEDSTWIL